MTAPRWPRPAAHVLAQSSADLAPRPPGRLRLPGEHARVRWPLAVAVVLLLALATWRARRIALLPATIAPPESCERIPLARP